MKDETKKSIIQRINSLEKEIEMMNPVSKALVRAGYNYLKDERKIDNILQDILPICSIYKIKNYPNILSFEGNKCSGKDTQINVLKSEGYSLQYIPRHIDNPAKKILAEFSTDIFYGISPVFDTLLGAACLNESTKKAFELYGYSIPYLFNRYKDSFRTIQTARLVLHGYDQPYTKRFCDTAVAYIPEPDITITLGLSQEETERRLISRDNYNLSLKEKVMSQKVNEYFKTISRPGYYYIEGGQNPESIAKEIKKIFDSNVRRED